MSHPPNRPRRPIRGPQSALTDFLASRNISAQQIRLDHERRVREAQEQQTQDGQVNHDDDELAATAVESFAQGSRDELQSPRMRKRRGKEPHGPDPKRKRITEKTKASKKGKKKKDGDSDEDKDYVDALSKRPPPRPGQIANCDVCAKRFTVTVYTRTGPNGGMLCNPCGKLLNKDGPSKKKPGRPQGSGRRKLQSNILDGTFKLGARSLMALCLDTLAKNIALADDLGELPPRVVDKVARRLSKARLLDSRTIDLFLIPISEDVLIYDGGKLSNDDMLRIFQLVPSLKNLKIKNAIQFNDDVMDYLLSREIQLNGFYLHGANLLSEAKWQAFLLAKGKSLRSLRVYCTDKHFGDETLQVVGKACPSLTRLKVEHNQQVSKFGVLEIAKMKTLEHVGLGLQKQVHANVYVNLVKALGQNLKTLSLSRVFDMDNTVLDAIHNSCRKLEKLRITESEAITDEGFMRLFSGWKNKGLVFLDLEKCRYVDAQRPRNNDDKIGLCSDGFKALMAHSGRTLQRLNIHACRHISASTFEDVFKPGQEYHELEKLEISFCENVTDFIVGSIFRSCPNLHELNVFGCMKVRNAQVPVGKILVGVPNAIGMIIEGEEDRG